MKIASANLQFSASHSLLEQRKLTERFDSWSGQRPQQQALPPTPRVEEVRLSDNGMAAAKAERSTDESVTDETKNDPRLALIRSLIERLTGRTLKIFDSRDLHTSPDEAPVQETPQPPAAPATSAGWGMVYERHESYTESEQTDFAASGTVQTADGREIRFEVQLSMARTFHQESDVSLRFGDAARKTDPLVLNFAGTAAQLTDQRFAFDLNADGKTEQINFVSPGSGFLVFDRNQDGKVNDGRELFGPLTNSGFEELRALDKDNNGWIDENDPDFAKLQVWTRDAAGKDQLRSLAAMNVGAIGLASVSTPFAIKNDSNRTLGEICNSGIFLLESGVTGTIQQIDLTA